MANVVEHHKYLWTEQAENHNKFWNVTLFDNDDVMVEYARVGNSPQSLTHSGAGRSKMEKLMREKENKGYKKINLIDVDTTKNASSSVVVQNDLHNVAKSQITHSCPQVAKLIEYFAKKNVHNIVANTKLTYNVQTGLFATPLGILQPTDIATARTLLIDISDYVAKNNYKSKKFISSLEEYLTLVPQDIGMKWIPERILPDLAAVQKQNDILDSLEASYQSVTANPPKADTTAKNDKPQPKIFDVKVELIDDKKEIDRIRRFYNGTRKAMHASYGYDVKEVYSIGIISAIKDFNDIKVKIGNIMELFHGTSSSNCLNILRVGLKTRPPSTANVTGKMFGSTGIYFSDQSTKSLNYATGYWGNGYDSRVFMFIADVAMGKYYVPSGPSSNLPKPGYDSTFAKAHVSGVINNEMIVYNEKQVNLKYLVEFEK